MSNNPLCADVDVVSTDITGTASMDVIFNTTTISAISISNRIKMIVENMKAPLSISIENGIAMPDVTIKAKDTARYPLVILINGAGGNGKDTFVEAVGKSCSALNLSSIQEVKDAAKVLIDYSDKHERNSGATICAGKHMEMKTDRYRTFLHDIKMAWTKFCDGPNNCLIGELRDTISHQINGGEIYDVIFMHVRETEELDKIKERIINDLGLICLTVLVKGLVNPNTYTNDGDANVYNYSYDLVIENQMMKKEMFELQAHLFGQQIVTANMIHGIPSINIAVPSLNQESDVTIACGDPSNAIGTISGDTVGTHGIELESPAAEPVVVDGSTVKAGEKVGFRTDPVGPGESGAV